MQLNFAFVIGAQTAEKLRKELKNCHIRKKTNYKLKHCKCNYNLFGQETSKEPYRLRVKLPHAHLSTTYGGGITLSL